MTKKIYTRIIEVANYRVHYEEKRKFVSLQIITFYFTTLQLRFSCSDVHKHIIRVIYLKLMSKSI